MGLEDTFSDSKISYNITYSKEDAGTAFIELLRSLYDNPTNTRTPLTSPEAMKGFLDSAIIQRGKEPHNHINKWIRTTHA